MVLIPAGFAQANWKFSGTGAPHGTEVTLGLDVSAFAGTAAQAATECFNAYATRLMPQASSVIVLNACEVKFGPSATGPTGLHSGSTVGGLASTAVSPNTTYLVSKVTAFGGRAGRGRMYLPGPIETEVGASGGIDGARITALNAALALFGSDLSTDLLFPVLLHGPDSPLSTPSPITAFQTSAVAATQRRRMRR